MKVIPIVFYILLYTDYIYIYTDWLLMLIKVMLGKNF